jgi:Flp pilus assembly protein TadG
MKLSFNVKAKRSESGLALVEFAMLVPLLSLLLIGIVELGRFTYYSILVGNAAHAGVQYGAQSLVAADDSAGMQTAALNDGQRVSGLTAVASHFCQCADGSSSTCKSTDCSSTHRLTYVQVTAAGTLAPLFRYPGLPTSYNLSKTAVMLVVQQ